VLALLKTHRQALNTATTLEAVRGHEGRAARTVFTWLQQQIKPALRRDFSAERRSRGGPDRLNSMLNFGYFLLFARLNTLVRSHGLNPYLGLLHDSGEDYETLVSDFQEPFRVHVDRLVINLINYESIRADGFAETPKGLWLTRPSARSFVLAFEKTLGEKVGNVVLRDAMLAQVRALKRCILGEGPFWVYCWKPVPAEGRPTSPTTALEHTPDADSAGGDAGAASTPERPPEAASPHNATPVD
jgi:CRISPR-associated protein Cas1